MIVDHLPRGQEGPGRGARVPADQPPARLPGVRQGRRVPAAGPDLRTSARARPASSRRSATSKSRSRCRPWCCSTGSAASSVTAAPASAEEIAGDPLIHFVDAGQRHRGGHLPRPSVRLVLLGQHGADLPGRRPHLDALPVHGPAVGPRAGREHVHLAAPWGAGWRSQSSGNRITRYLGIDSDPVNQSWLCDRGRFDFEAVNSDDRLDRAAGPQGRRAGRGVVGRGPRRGRRRRCPRCVQVTGRTAIGVIGGARLTNEDAYAWAKLAKGVLGTDNVDAQLGDGLPPSWSSGCPGPPSTRPAGPRRSSCSGPT